MAMETESNMSRSENQEGKQLAPQYETEGWNTTKISVKMCTFHFLAQLSLFGFNQPFILLTTDS